ncbi:V-type H+-transporting ATPase subunit H [Nematocida sp. LUAm3]|nr:V-type H+-transporting ATPase subunit H [Nematocida sp. LUAm3]KAI5175679.1 V-type H+-transporting ATPase subunit H [Nematocida sp. LUAm2]KAI5178585.1 V-type H+-transporting ATPase subunit H [Nematocida sp. LUAm1]
MPVEKYINEIKECTTKNRIRELLLELGGMDPEILDQQDLLDLLLHLGKEPDLLISLKALQILTKVYRHRNTADPRYYEIVAQIIRDSPTSKKAEQILIFLQRLATLDYLHQKINSTQVLLEDPMREEISGNEALISSVLTACTKRECKYQGLLLLWILSFSERALQKLEKSPMFNMLSFVSKECKEKELRISLAIVRNYFTHITKYNYGAFQKIEELLSVATTRGNKEDPEEQEDLMQCRERFTLLSRAVSTFGSYMEELESGCLHPYSYHFSDEFWKNNVELLRQKRVEIFKCLKRYLKSKDSDNIWISANDIYRIIEVLPDSITLLRQMGIHQVLFEVLSTKSSDDIQFHAMEALSLCYTKE